MNVLVVVPSLNEENSIESCLKSVKSQKTSDSIKIVLCDGKSNDKTTRLAKKYADKIIISNKRNVAIQRNTGANAFDSDLILFLDADTILPPDYIQWGIEKFRKNPDLLGFSAGFTFSESDSTLLFSEKITNEYLKFRDRIGSPTLPGFNIFITRKAFELVNGFHDVPLEDIDFSRRLREHGRTNYFTEMKVITSSRRLSGMGLIGTLRYYFEMDLARIRPDLKKYLIYSEYLACRQPPLYYKKIFDELYNQRVFLKKTREKYDIILQEIRDYLLD